MTTANQAGACRKPFVEATGLPIGMQLFPLMAQLRDDLARTLGRIGAIGYEMVETAGLLGYDAHEFRAALDAAGLTCGGMHVQAQSPFGPGQNLTDDIDAVIADARVLGTRQIVMPLFFFPDNLCAPADATPGEKIRLAAAALGPSDYRRMADFLNAKGRYLSERDMRLSYHNHNAEFAPQDGSTGMEMLLELTDPDHVDFELDIGWAAAAGADIPSLLEAHEGRFTQMHVKDIAPTTRSNYVFCQDPARIGHGVINFARVLPLAYQAGVRSYYIEQEAPFTGDPIDSFEANYHALTAITV